MKVSRSDFAAGYCTGGDLNHVMVPKGLVTPDELVPGVGLIEVNLNEPLHAIGVCVVLR